MSEDEEILKRILKLTDKMYVEWRKHAKLYIEQKDQFNSELTSDVSLQISILLYQWRKYLK